MRGIIENLPAGENQVTILDMGATPEPFSRGTLKPIEVLLLIAEPYYKSLEAVVRMSDLARQLEIPHIEVVANKVRS
ncbi:MAG: AAA family ATPase, partial [Candidatus Methylomirabilales bacterium]